MPEDVNFDDLIPSQEQANNLSFDDLVPAGPRSTEPRGLMTDPTIANTVRSIATDPTIANAVRDPVGTARSVATNPAIMNAAKALGGYLYDNKGDVVGSVGGGVGGGLGGFALGGPIGAVAGSIAGGITGATIGKEVDEALETREPKSIVANAGISTLEEFFGRLVGPWGARGVSSGLRMAGLDGAAKSLDDLFLKSSDINPLDTTGDTIIDAQTRQLGERVLTTFEETGGAAGQSLQALLDDSVRQSSGVSKMHSEYLKNRRETVQKLVNNIKPSTPINKSEQAIADGLQDVVVNTRKRIKGELNEIEPVLAKAREKITVPLGRIENDIGDVRSQIYQKLGDTIADQLFSVINKYLLKETAGGATAYKEKMAFDQMVRMEKDVQNAVGKFNPSLNIQKDIAGVYGDIIRPILDRRVASAREFADKGTQKIFALQDRSDALGKALGQIDRSRLARLGGGTASAQAIKDKTAKQLDNLVFSTPRTWRDTVEVLEASGAHEMVGLLKEKFRSNIMRDIWNPKSKEFSVAKITSVLDGPNPRYGEDLIREVADEKFVKTLQDIRLIQDALDVTKNMTVSSPVLAPGQRIFENFRRMAVHPLAGRVGLVQGVMSRMRNYIGLGNVTDEQLFKSFQGERGQLLLEKMMNDPLADPKSYNTYVQFVREATKAGADIQLFSRDKYLEGVAEGLNDVVTGFESAE